MEDVVITNLVYLEKTKQKIAREGKTKLHVVTDFDRTLTTAFVNGEKVSFIISVLRDGNYLTKDYAEKANALYKKYHAIEISSEIPLSEKKKAMHKWWTTHFGLLIKSRLNRKDLEKVVNSGKVRFRKGALQFLELLHKQNIPLVILSSAGLGEESISLYFNRHKKLYENIYIISNSFEWDKNGYLVGFKEPITHSMNKDETSIKEFPAYKAIKNRKNVLLLGDTLEDIEMIKGFSSENLIKIGFLNENIEENLDAYKKVYDVVILNDGTMDYVNKLLREIIK